MLRRGATTNRVHHQRETLGGGGLNRQPSVFVMKNDGNMMDAWWNDGKNGGKMLISS
jgi:hypothetical protein